MTDEVVQGRDPVRPPTGGRHRRTLVMAAVVLAFLAVVVVVGVVRGKPDAAPRPSTSPSPTAAGTTPSSAKPLQLTAVRCAKFDGEHLTVGFGIVDRGPGPFVVSTVTPVFPLGGLTPDAAGVPDVTSCPTPATGLPHLFGEGDQALLAIVLTPTDPHCIAPLPIDIEVDYGSGDDNAYTDTLHAFPDLGNFGLPGDCSSPGG